MLTSKSIKDIALSDPEKVYIIIPAYSGREIECTYKESWKSITTFTETSTGEEHHILRGHMKFLRFK
jgi:hypothetical protein